MDFQVSSLINSSVVMANGIDEQFQIKKHVAIGQSLHQLYRVIRDFKRLYIVIPEVAQSWHACLKMQGKQSRVKLFFGMRQSAQSRLETWQKVFAVTGSFFCIMGNLGQFFCAETPRLYLVARLADLVGFGLLFTQGIVTLKLDQLAHTGSPHNFKPLFSMASHACDFIARAVHILVLCSLVKGDQTWTRRGLEGAAVIFSLVVPAKNVYVKYVQGKAKEVKKRK